MITFFVSIIGVFIPVFIIFVVFSILFKVLRTLSRKPEKRRGPSEQQTEENPSPSGRDLASEFERKLKAKMKSKNAADTVVTDAELPVYKEPVLASAEPAAAGKLQDALRDVKEKRRFKHPQLVNGFIMSRILEKPRSIDPYREIDL